MDRPAASVMPASPIGCGKCFRKCFPSSCPSPGRATLRWVFSSIRVALPIVISRSAYRNGDIPYFPNLVIPITVGGFGIGMIVVPLTVSAIALVSFAGLRAIDRGVDDGRVAIDDPWSGYEVFERTATVGHLTITSPSDWYLVDQWRWALGVPTTLGEQLERAIGDCHELGSPEERGDCISSVSSTPGDGAVSPVAMLSDTDRGLLSSPCLDPSFSLNADEAVMTVALDPLLGAGSEAPASWPVGFEGRSPSDRTSCGPGTYVYFSKGDVPYVAHFAIGDDAWIGCVSRLRWRTPGCREHEGGQQRGLHPAHQ